ncbi:MAG: TlyA family RNA methyltransferase, partial [Sulfurovaceae bacterium]|nr:TlyA family RNA methyltransferase [Sulfurovaceae bacterium]
MKRVDKYLVEKGYFESRNRAIDAIKRGKVFVDGKIAKPSTKCNDNSNIDIDSEKFYVSRASKKLELFLEEYPINLKDKIALDIGSSTGGFVQILLENGVKSVTAVDVGSNQLHHSLRDNPKVEIFENTDIRDFKTNGVFDIVTCDVSFISILQIIEDIDRLSNRDMILLFKPQF